MKISASAAIEGTYEILVAASSFGPSEVTRQDYSVLTTAPGGCSLVIRYRGSEVREHTFGEPIPRFVVHRIDVEGYVRDLGDPLDMLERQVRLADEIVGVLHSDSTLGGRAKRAMVREVMVAPDFVLEIGGFRWLPMTVRLEAEQF